MAFEILWRILERARPFEYIYRKQLGGEGGVAHQQKRDPKIVPPGTYST
jgi:hypothetical protein